MILWGPYGECESNTITAAVRSGVPVSRGRGEAQYSHQAQNEMTTADISSI